MKALIEITPFEIAALMIGTAFLLYVIGWMAFAIWLIREEMKENRTPKS